MRTGSFVLACVLLAPVALGQGEDQVHDFSIQRLAPMSVDPPESFTVKLMAAHRCPAAGAVRFLAGAPGDPAITVATTDGSWGECRSDNYHYATGSMQVSVAENATHGVHGVAVGAYFAGKVADTALQVNVPWRGSAKASGPEEGLALPGRATNVRIVFDVQANGDAWIVTGHDLPSTWKVEAAPGVEVAVPEGTGRGYWDVRVTPPEDARGDHTFHFAGAPHDALTRKTNGATTAHRWTLHLPMPTAPRESEDRPADPATKAGAPTDAPAAAPEPVDEGVPAWVIAAGLITVAVAAIAWTRRKP